MSNCDVCDWSRRAFVVASAVAVGLSIIPSAASAQTVLPDINVIAPTPLSGTRNTKPSTSTAAPATSAPSGAPAAGTAGPADLTSIDRDKVPSNTVVLTPNDFNHEYTPDFLDALNRGLPGDSLSDQTGNPFDVGARNEQTEFHISFTGADNILGNVAGHAA
jgi:iron complex outermembrane recepter protein